MGSGIFTFTLLYELRLVKNYLSSYTGPVPAVNHHKPSKQTNFILNHKRHFCNLNLCRATITFSTTSDTSAVLTRPEQRKLISLKLTCLIHMFSTDKRCALTTTHRKRVTTHHMTRQDTYDITTTRLRDTLISTQHLGVDTKSRTVAMMIPQIFESNNPMLLMMVCFTLKHLAC